MKFKKKHGWNTGHLSSGSSLGSDTCRSSNLCRLSFFTTPAIRSESSCSSLVNGKPVAEDHINLRPAFGTNSTRSITCAFAGRQGGCQPAPMHVYHLEGTARRGRTPGRHYGSCRDPAHRWPTWAINRYSPFWASGSGSPEAPLGFFFTLPVILGSSSTNAGTGVLGHIVLQACRYPTTPVWPDQAAQETGSTGIKPDAVTPSRLQTLTRTPACSWASCLSCR